MATKNSTSQAATTKAVAPKATPVAKAKAVVAKATTSRTKVASKVCRVCSVNKPLTDYRAKASRPDGRDSLCADCARAWLANRKAVLASQAKVAKPKATAKPAAKPAAAKTTKPAAKVVAKAPTLPAREAAARARDAKAKVATVAR